MEIFLAIYLFYFGATFASFFNVVGIRVHEKHSINSRSSCPKCGNTLRWIDIIPIFGFIINRAKCHFCKEPIHPKYLFIELFGGLTLMVGFLVYSISLELLLYFVFTAALMILAVCMYEYKSLLNLVIYIVLPFIIAIEVFISVETVFLGLAGGILFLVMTTTGGLINRKIYKYIPLFTMIGLTIGIYACPLFILLFAISIGLKFLLDKIRFPYSYLFATVTIIAMLFGTELFEIIFNFTI